ncbi:hypothetical protein EBZ37_09680 [bacterium]|nr:hypothetical protein [bacterium]
MLRFRVTLAILLLVQAPQALTNEATPGALEFSQLSLPQVFYYDEKKDEAFAHLVSFKIGSLTLQQDVQAQHPLTQSPVPVVGALSAFHWGGGPTDSFEISFTVSSVNQKLLENYLRQPNASAEIELNFQIFTKSPESSEKFIRLKTFTYPFRGIMNRVGSEILSNKPKSLPVKGSIAKTNGRLAFTLASTAGTQILNPPNFSVKLSAQPRGSLKQTLIWALDPETTQKVFWGP